jgi:hypothetical protein
MKPGRFIVERLRAPERYTDESELRQDGLPPILGGNVVRLFDHEAPHARLFSQVVQA